MKRIIFSLSILFSLVLFGFVANSTDSNLVLGNDWTGTWSSTYGELRLISEGDVVYGDYADVGVLYGIRNHDGHGKQTFVGKFINYSQNKEGAVDFIMDDANLNNSFTGKWTWDTALNWNNWTGRKNSTTKPTLKSFYKVTGRCFDANLQPITSEVNVQFFKNGICHFVTKTTNGHYSHVLPKGMWEIKVRKEGYKEYKSQINVTSNYPNGNPYHLVNIQLIKN